MNIHRAALTLFILMLMPFAARAEYFQYTDDSGTVVMVDDESKIPKKYRKKNSKPRVAAESSTQASEAQGRGGRVHTDSEGKQIASNPDDCDQADFSKLDAELRQLGYMAGAGGGYSRSGSVYVCSPCVKRVNSRVPLEGDVLDVYKPVKSVVFKYTSGASYEYCTIKGR